MSWGRYPRLLISFGRYGLARELAFRGNFVVKVGVEVLWLCILLGFYWTVFTKTQVVAGWTQDQYLFFVGCFFALESVVETFFLGNCVDFADLVRSGDLDFYLLKPIDEQFLVSCRTIDWSTAPNLLLGAGVMATALSRIPGWTFSPVQFLCFLLTFACGVGIAYSFLLALASTAIWFVRNQSLMELWWLFTSLMRYPKEVYEGMLPRLGWFLAFLVPIMLVVNVPAQVMVKMLDNPLVLGATVLVAALLLAGSRAFFQHALRRYRSASS